MVSKLDTLIDEIAAGLKGVPQELWFYRPEEFDDWGYIRGEPNGREVGKFVARAITHNYLEEDELNQHRTNKTDPSGQVARHIARCSPNNMRALIDSHKKMKEALEEAGLRGDIVGEPLGGYEDFKWNSVLRVTVLLMEVSQCDEDWLENDVRERCWVSPERATVMLSKPVLRRFVEEAAGRIVHQ